MCSVNTDDNEKADMRIIQAAAEEVIPVSICDGIL